ncbi:MAG: glycosyltransferase [Pricia sp.]
MNLGIFIYSMAGGGAERVVSYLLPYLKEQGYGVHLILMNSTISYKIPDNVNIHYLEKSRGDESGICKFLKLPFLAYKYAKLSKKLGLTHSFSLLSRPNYVNVIMKYFNRKPPAIIISERNYASMIYGYGDMQSKINSFLVKKLYPKADQVIGNSKANVKDLIENYGIRKEVTAVIENPIDLEKIKAIEPFPDFLDKSCFNMISVGRFEHVKNQQLLIKALVRVPTAQLYLLGRGILGKNLQELVEKENLSDRVHFLGFDPNPYKYLKSADLFVFGSNHEGFPNVLLEAMCCGLPILTTNCKSGPDEIMELEEPSTNKIMKTPYGILTPVGNVDLMTEGMNYFIQNPEYLRFCGQNALQRIKAFEKKGILQAYETALLRQ